MKIMIKNCRVLGRYTDSNLRYIKKCGKKCITKEYGERTLKKTEKMCREFVMPCHGCDTQTLILFGLQRAKQFQKKGDRLGFLVQ